MLRELAARVRQGLRVTGVPASQRTASIATSLGIPLLDLDDVPALAFSIDGADEVTLPNLHLIKGGGGALLREKQVAAASRYRIIIVDASKLVSVLGTGHPIPVEVTPFGWRHTAARLASLGCQPQLRLIATAGTGAGETSGSLQHPYVTDGGNYILDCRFASIADPEALARAIKMTIGVVEHGLFLSMTERVYVGDAATGVRAYDRPS
jgi:ribose 5-phosphate isomerase A